ncbi:hypothetical protein N1851_017545 [Merluccius polli]|uniref:Uncharacterized protein n=1 Tax=Merluccius polli TaxID=89951 RepID=A0AA47MPX0_MERPO|nr:hypothetical protein N1851_017545 [Merluccius polli]
MRSMGKADDVHVVKDFKLNIDSLCWERQQNMSNVSPELSSLLVLLAAHLDVLPAPWIPAGLYGLLPPDVGPVFSPSRWLFLDSLVARGTVSSVLWRHVLQHVTTHTTVESPFTPSSVCGGRISLFTSWSHE